MCEGKELFESVLEEYTEFAIKSLEESECTAVSYEIDFISFSDTKNKTLSFLDKGNYLVSLTKIGSKYGVRLGFLIKEDSVVSETMFTPDLNYYETSYRKVVGILKVSIPSPPGPGTPYTELKPQRTGLKKAA